jgi:hypothetical protein
MLLVIRSLSRISAHAIQGRWFCALAGVTDMYLGGERCHVDKVLRAYMPACLYSGLPVAC